MNRLLLIIGTGAILTQSLVFSSIVWKDPKEVAKNPQSIWTVKNYLEDFDQWKIVDVEGYWATSKDPKKDKYKGKYPFPEEHADRWPGQKEFLDKLHLMEQAAEPEEKVRNKTIGIVKFAVKGDFRSVFNGERLGNIHYKDKATGIEWTGDFGPYYVDKFNVRPSEQFYKFVMTFKLPYSYDTTFQGAKNVLKDFDREKIIGREGDWATSKDPKKDRHEGKFPFPIAHEKPWPGKKDFLDKLHLMEKSAQEESNVRGKIMTGIVKNTVRGHFENPLNGEESFGNIAYKDMASGIEWYEDFGDRYVDKFNVIPSEQFYIFVMTYKLPKGS